MLAVAASLAAASAAEPGVPGVPIVFTQLPVAPEKERTGGRAGGALPQDYGEGGRLVRLDPEGGLHLLSGDFQSACGADVSFDGQRLLFAGKRHAGDAWDIWEMQMDGTGVRQITRNAGNCRSPAYQATLYTIVSNEPWYQIMFVSDAAGEMNEYGASTATSIYSCKLDGSGLRRLTFNLSDDLDPFLMQDGRVLLASWQRMDLRRGYEGRVALFDINTDGTDYAFYAGTQGARIKQMPCATREGLVIFVEADRVDWDGAGQLAAVTQRRPLYSYRKLTNDPAWVYHSPAPLRDGEVLVARRPAGREGTHGLCRYNPRTGAVQTVFDDPAWHDVHARVLAPRPEADGRSSVVNEEYATGKLYCLNAYQSEPQVQAHLRPGVLRQLRVIEGLAVPATDAGAYFGARPNGALGGPGARTDALPGMAARRLLGVVAVEEDGSFQIEVPADTPIQLQVLDEDGLALQSCGWIWVKPKESRGCIGCHEDPELAPENRFVAALSQPAPRLTLPPERRRSVSFQRDMMLIVNGKCAGCHNDASSGLDLRADPVEAFNRAYLSLLAVQDGVGAGDTGVRSRYLTPGEARSSPLVWRILGRNTSRPWDASFGCGGPSGVCPPPGAAPLTPEEKLTIIEWVDLGACWSAGQSLGGTPPPSPAADNGGEGHR